MIKTSTDTLKVITKLTKLTEGDVREAARVAVEQSIKWGRKEASEGLADIMEIPYREVVKRLRIKRRTSARSSDIMRSGIWMGFNPVSYKFLSKYGTLEETEGGLFTNDKLHGHVFKRVGKDRLPIEKMEMPIEREAMQYLTFEFQPNLERYFLEAFYTHLDKMTASGYGTSRSLIEPNL